MQFPPRYEEAWSTQPNPSPRSCTQESVKNALRTRSPRGRSPSGIMARLLQSACSTSQKKDADLGKSALMHTARLMNSLATGLKRMVTKVQWLY